MIQNIAFYILLTFNIALLIRWILKRRSTKKTIVDFSKAIQQWKLTPVYETEKGVKVYGYDNPMKMPANRALSAEIASNQAGMKITRDSLLGMLTAMEEAGNDGQIIDLFGYIARLKQRLTWACERETLFSLANCYLVIEGEDPEVVEPKYTKMKKEIIESDPKAEGFFLGYALKLTNDYGNISDSDILNYLATKETQEGTTR